MPVNVNGKNLTCPDPDCGETERIGISGMDSTGGTPTCGTWGKKFTF